MRFIGICLDVVPAIKRFIISRNFYGETYTKELKSNTRVKNLNILQ